MSEFITLAYQGIKRRKKASLLLFAVLTISFMFSIISLSVMTSISKTNEEFLRDTFGSWYFGLPKGLTKDEKWLQNQEWVENIGKSTIYGTVPTQSRVSAVGTIDHAFVEIGRIKLDSGRFPESDNEIVMEEDVLNALGYNTELNQNIELRIRINLGQDYINVTRRYTLVGILHEYSDLWVLEYNCTDQPLVSSVITEREAETIFSLAKEIIKDSELENLAYMIQATPQFFVSVSEENRVNAKNILEDYLLVNSENRDKFACENLVAFPILPTTENTEFNFYLITLITFVAVICVSIMQLSDETRRFTILRSIGMTKPQLGSLLFIETLMIALPAVITGIPLGAAGTWIFLRMMLYSGSVPITVVIPFSQMGHVILTWCLSILLSRIVLFSLVINTPLIGRMQLSQCKDRKINHFRNTLIILLLASVCFITIITFVDSLKPRHEQTYWELCPSYTIWRKTLVSIEEANTMKKIPGVTRVNGFGEMDVLLSFQGFDDSNVLIYSIDASDWQESLDFKDGIDDFEAGNYVIIAIPEETEEECIFPKDTVTLKVKNRAGGIMGELETEAEVQIISKYALNRLLSGFYIPYSVFCSRAFVEQMLSTMETGKMWDKYVAGKDYGYDRVYVNTDLNADNLLTDTSLSNFCFTHDLIIDNRRQIFQAYVQEKVQKLIMLYSLWICITLIVLLILISTLSLETEREKIYFGILRAIGMSLRQERLQIFIKALYRSTTGLLIGIIAAIAFEIRKYINGNSLLTAFTMFSSDLKSYNCDNTDIAVLLGICLLILLAVMFASKISLKKGEFKV